MNYQCKRLLTDTIEQFKLVPISERESKLNFVKRQLLNVNNPDCFFESAEHFVIAAKIFLRVAYKVPFN